MNYFWGDLLDSRFYVAYLISKIKSDLIIDVGCGVGVLLHFSNVPFKVGLDLSFESLKAAQKLDSNLNLIQSDSRYLPLKSLFCKNILAIHIISALKNKNSREKIMEEIRRVTADNCQIIIAGANRRSKFFEGIYSEKENFDYTHYSDIEKFYQKDFKIKSYGYGSFSNSIMKLLQFI